MIIIINLSIGMIPPFPICLRLEIDKGPRLSYLSNGGLFHELAGKARHYDACPITES